MKTNPATPNKTKQPYYSSKVFQYGMAVLVVIIALSSVGIPIAIYFTRPKTTTTTTTTPASSPLNWSINETVYGVWSTIAGGNSVSSTSGNLVGNYYALQIPLYACDNILTNAYTSFGNCTSSSVLTTCGVNTGFYVTPQRGAAVITGFQIYTAGGLVNRDPITVTIEGSNQPISVLPFGISWNLLYSGTSGLATDPGRLAWGTQISFSNTVQYTSYRFLITSIRGADSSTWYAEVQLIGY